MPDGWLFILLPAFALKPILCIEPFWACFILQLSSLLYCIGYIHLLCFVRYFQIDELICLCRYNHWYYRILNLKVGFVKNNLFLCSLISSVTNYSPVDKGEGRKAIYLKWRFRLELHNFLTSECGKTALKYTMVRNSFSCHAKIKI